MLLYQRIPLHLRQVDWDRILASSEPILIESYSSVFFWFYFSGEMEIQSGSPCRTLKISGFPDWTEAKDVHELFFIYGHIVVRMASCPHSTPSICSFVDGEFQ